MKLRNRNIVLVTAALFVLGGYLPAQAVLGDESALPVNVLEEEESLEATESPEETEGPEETEDLGGTEGPEGPEDLGETEGPEETEDLGETESMEETDSSDETESELTLAYDIDDAIKDVEYGKTEEIYRFDDAILQGVKPGGEVYLVADAEYDSVNAGDRKIKLTNLRLEGANAADYKLPDIPEPVIKSIRITPKAIRIAPKRTYIFYGQDSDYFTEEIADYSGQILHGDQANVEACFGLEFGENVGQGGTVWLNSASCDNGNYTVGLDDQIVLEVKEFVPREDEVAQTSTNHYFGVKKATLEAPDGFQISLDGQKDSQWSGFVEIELKETRENQEGKAVYYLRNIQSDKEYYQAISAAQTYSYTSVQTLPEIEWIWIEKADENSTLNFFPETVFGNGSVKVTVEVAGAFVEQETKVYLGGSGEYEAEAIAVEPRDDGRYHYTAEFIYDVPQGMDLKAYVVEAYAVNSSGTGDTFSRFSGINDKNGEIMTLDFGKLVLEKAEPEVNAKPLDGNYQNSAVKADVTMSDSVSGIAKVEYLWDAEYQPEAGAHRDYVVFDGYSPDETDYEFILPWQDAVTVPGNRHTLHLKVTDNAGNVCYREFTDSIGSDMLAPSMESVEIRKASSDGMDENIKLRFLPFGIFSSDTVEIAVIVNDNEQDGFYASGVRTVKINDRIMDNKGGKEYVLTVSPDDMMEGMCIAAEDKVGLTASAMLTDISGKADDIKSNFLMVEDDAPTIFWKFSFAGYEDESGKIWYGGGNAKDTLTITLEDKEGDIHSGLYSIKITDNDTVIFEKTVFSAIELQYTETFAIGDFEDGSHTFVVTVEDNAGNVCEESQTFHIDTDPPDNGTVSVIAPEGLDINGERWYDYEKDKIIAFRVDASDVASGLKSVSVKINGQSFKFVDDDILADEDGSYVEVDTTDIEPDDNHKYVLTGTVTDIAHNTLTMDALIVHMDCENPAINRFTAERKNENSSLNVLPFGVYSNDALILRVYATDTELGSGVDYVTVSYNGLSEPMKMKDGGGGMFSVEISASGQVFESDVTVVAYDKCGKRSTAMPNIQDALSGDAANNRFVMIESIEPRMSLDLPAGDGVPRGDGQIWYKASKTFSLEVQDENSGIREVNFSVNGVGITSDSGGVDLPKAAVTKGAKQRDTKGHSYAFDIEYLTSQSSKAEDGRYTVMADGFDNAGNTIVYTAVYYMDDILPVIESIDFSAVTSDGIGNTEEFTTELEYEFFFKNAFTITVNVSDEEPTSGLDEVRYRFVPYEDGVRLEEITGVEKIEGGMATVAVPDGFKGQIFVEAFDNVGNSSGEMTTKAYIIDDMAPEVRVLSNVPAAYQDGEGNSLYTENNSITVEITDMVSGIREIGYSQSSEYNSMERKVIAVDNAGHHVGDGLEDGWMVSSVDQNLVTGMTKTFTFSEDDNDIVLTFDATDNALNVRENVESEKFTIDKTIPLIYVSFRDDVDDDVYYSQNRVADIRVIERNFDQNLINVAITNMFGNVPSFTFTEISKTEHVAVIIFDEGDFTFDVTGTDLGNHVADVSYSGGNERLFFVDKTKPVVEENFVSFINGGTENSFNTDKTVTIRVTEHNFEPDLAGLHIFRKDAGEEHDTAGLVDVTYGVLGGVGWSSANDVHTISFVISDDAVYQVEIAPSDLAGNAAETEKTVVFEIDQTVPVVTAKNGNPVNADDIEFLDIYPYSRKDDPAPTVEFEDLNLDHIEYDLTVYIPDYTDSEADIVIKPVRVYLEEDGSRSGKIAGGRFVLPDFVEDGVYALELTAVDVAGNESAVNVNTYARMIARDVLAYILESNPEQGTGLYSFQYENGTPISKRPDNFSDIKISALAGKDTDVDIVLRDNDGNEYRTNARATMDESVYGINIYNFILEADYFKETFQNDTDIELRLTVKNGDDRVDLGKMHIDGIMPTCDIPKEFRSWHWYYGEEDRTIVISNISELIDTEQSFVYDNGRKIEYIYSEEDNTLTFTLGKGWHNVGIRLTDMAGNANNIQERLNIHVGFFWLRMGIAGSMVLLTVAVFLLVRYRWKRRAAEQQFLREGV